SAEAGRFATPTAPRPASALRFAGVQDTMCQVKFWLMHLKWGMGGQKETHVRRIQNSGPAGSPPGQLRRGVARVASFELGLALSEFFKQLARPAYGLLTFAYQTTLLFEHPLGRLESLPSALKQRLRFGVHAQNKRRQPSPRSAGPESARPPARP